VIQIAKSCPCLIKLSLQWNLGVTSAGICCVITNCVFLKKLDCTGLKNLRDDCLEPCLEMEKENKRTGLRSLVDLSFNRCDYVSTSLLEKVKAKFKGMEIYDFYNELIL
jgi:hypothetical protein